MKPRIDIDIRDDEGKPAELQDANTFEPFEIYLNDERIFTSEKVEELESENASLRGAVEGFAEQNAKLRKELKDVLSLLRLGARSGEGISREWCRERLDYYSDRMRDLGIEVE